MSSGAPQQHPKERSITTNFDFFQAQQRKKSLSQLRRSYDIGNKAKPKSSKNSNGNLRKSYEIDTGNTSFTNFNLNLSNTTTHQNQQAPDLEAPS